MRSPGAARSTASWIDWPGRTTSVRAEAGKPAKSRQITVMARMVSPQERTANRSAAACADKSACVMPLAREVEPVAWAMDDVPGRRCGLRFANGARLGMVRGHGGWAMQEERK